MNFMKTRLLLAGFLFGILIFFSGCVKENGEKDWSENVKILVSSELGEYRPFMSDTIVLGMKIKEENEIYWQVIHIQSIQGFAFQEGNEYILLVKKTHIANPPQDSSNIEYTLLEVLSKKRVSK